MKIFFYPKTDLRNRSDFRMYCIQQNINTTQTASLIFLLMCVIIRVIFEVIGSPVQKNHHLDEYEQANWISLAIVPFFYIGSIQLKRLFLIDKKYAAVVWLVVFLFALFLILNAMRVTFFVIHNPRNTFVMYMVGLIMVGIFFTFEFYETLALTILTGACFSVTLLFYQHVFIELLLNNLASLVLLTVFFAISRFSYSYKADYFFKLKAIEEKTIEIENASRVKNEILGVVAHDLRNPLAAIQTIAMMMETDKNIDAENRDYLQMIKTSCDKATSIINDLLETANNDSDKEFELERAELNKFLLIIVDEWLKNKNGQVNILYYGTKQPVYALINKEKMHRVMDNLISNAVKFSSSSEHVEVLLNELNEHAVINVKDSGVGIPANLLPHIFDRFSKASRRGVRGEESVGLGLSIVHEIIRKHRGEITVESNETSGTKFAIKLKAVS
jgi:two-component system sensor histidine kinase VicK